MKQSSPNLCSSLRRIGFLEGGWTSCTEESWPLDLVTIVAIRCLKDAPKQMRFPSYTSQAIPLPKEREDQAYIWAYGIL